MTSSTRRPRHLAIVAALALTALTGCSGSADPPPDTTSTTSSTTTAHSSTSTGGTQMKDEIATALEGVSPTIADAVRADDTSVTPVDAAALGDWQVVDIVRRGSAHPQRWFMGVKDGGREVVVLSGFPERWEQITAGARVASADEAAELAGLHADATRDMTRGYTRLGSVDDIRFLPKPTPEESDRIEQIRRDHADIAAPTATGDGPWTVTLWTVTDGDLVRHQVEVTADGAVTDTPETVESDLPVPRAR